MSRHYRMGRVKKGKSVTGSRRIKKGSTVEVTKLVKGKSDRLDPGTGVSSKGGRIKKVPTGLHPVLMFYGRKRAGSTRAKDKKRKSP